VSASKSERTGDSYDEVQIMAQKLLKYYELIQAKGGTKAKMRMAMLTSVPSCIAAEAPEPPAIIAKFQGAYKEITGQDAPPV
jgi:hypothetical protein